jgi:hypothetical protein
MSNVESKEIVDVTIPEGSEKEKEMSSTPTSEDCEQADKAENNALRRKGKLSDEQKLEVFRLVKSGVSRKAVIKKFNLSYYRIKKIEKECLEAELKALQKEDIVPQ